MELQPLIDRLAALPPSEHPFVSVYVDARHHASLRAELKARAATYPDRSAQREGLDRDVERILAWLEAEARPQANGLAIFACGGTGFFETAQLEVPFAQSEVSVGPIPHLYPLAAVADRFRRHAAAVLDSHAARIFVFGLGETLAEQTVEGQAMPRSEAGGWAQARYQRHVQEFQRRHARDVVEVLTRLVRDEGVDCVVIAANDVAGPLVRAEAPKDLAARIVEVEDLDMSSPRDRILHRSLEAARERDARDDAERVRRVLDAYRAGGLGVVGVDATLRALDNGQVHELMITADPASLRARDGRHGAEVADALVARARQTDARVSLIEDPALLVDAGGVGGLLRFRMRKAA